MYWNLNKNPLIDMAARLMEFFIAKIIAES
jgi:hypothetical protein